MIPFSKSPSIVYGRNFCSGIEVAPSCVTRLTTASNPVHLCCTKSQTDPRSHRKNRFVETTDYPTPRRRRSPQSQSHPGRSLRLAASPMLKQYQVRRTRKDLDQSVHQRCPLHRNRSTKSIAHLPTLRGSRQ